MEPSRERGNISKCVIWLSDPGEISNNRQARHDGKQGKPKSIPVSQAPAMRPDSSLVNSQVWLRV